MTILGWRFVFWAHRNEVCFRVYRVACPYKEQFGSFSCDGPRMMAAHKTHRLVGTMQEQANIETWKASNRARGGWT